MKSVIVIFLACTLSISAKAYRQAVTLRMKDATLQKVFRAIEQQTGYTFLYTKQMLEDAPKVNVQVTNVSLQQALNECLKLQKLQYSIHNKMIIITRKVNYAPVLKDNTPSDTLAEIRGVVLGESGSPLYGATVTITSLSKTAISNSKGEFVLTNVPRGKYKIQISFVGFDDFVAIVNVSGQSANLTAALKQVLSRLDEVTIIAYGTTTKRFSTGNASAVKSEEIEKQPVANPIAALQGRMTGVLVTSANGIPGSGITMQIRGRNSISGRSDPLYIVDGVPFTATSIYTVNTASGQVSPFNSINPGDIESISVLKDADATAIYGSRGANGVVLITTKKGKPGKTKLDINAYTGSSVATRVPEFLNTDQYLEIRKKAFISDNITPTTSNAQDLLLWDQNAYTNFPKMILGNTAPFTNVQAAMSGGNESTRLLLSLAYHNEGTVIFGNNYDKRVSGHFNVDHYSANKKFNINTSVSYTNDNIKTLAADPYLSIYIPPNFPRYDSTGALYWINRDAQANTANPWALLNRTGRTWTDNLITNTALRYTVLPGLQAKVNIGFTKMFMAQQVTMPTTAFNPTSTSTTKSSASFGNSSIQSYIVEPQVDYSRKIGLGQLSVLVGGTAQSSVMKSNSITGINYTSDDLIESIASAATITSKSNTNSQYKYISGFGRFNFRWMDKYIVNATFRRDGSSRFGTDKRFGNFWSLGGGWVFSEENAIKNTLPFISFGKFRASYGITGNDQIQDYKYLEFYTSNAVAYNGNLGLYANQIGNPLYAWEENKKLEVGVELGLFKDRILLSGSWYRSRSDNQLVQTTLPAQTGQDYYQANLPALVENKSWEFELSSTNINHTNFRWQTNFNITLPENVLVAFPDLESSVYAPFYRVGQPLSLFRGYHYTGLSATGVPEFEDQNKDGSLNSLGDYINIGTQTPKFYGGFGNTITWKGFSLDIFLQFTKQDGFNALRAFYFGPGYKANVPVFYVKDNWEASNPDGTQPAFSTSASNPALAGYAYPNRFYYSDAAFSDASYVRLKNVSISYSLPKKIIDKISAQQVRIYFQGQNLATLTDYEGLDPEVQNATPILKTFTGGIQLTF